MLAPIPGQMALLAQDNQQGPNAVVGGNGNCFKWQAPFGVNAKWIMTATKGSGMAAAQMFVR